MRWLGKIPALVTLTTLIVLHTYGAVKRLISCEYPKSPEEIFEDVMDSFFFVVFILTWIALVANLHLLLLVGITSLSMFICRTALDIMTDIVFFGLFGMYQDVWEFLKKCLYGINWIIFIWTYKCLVTTKAKRV